MAWLYYRFCLSYRDVEEMLFVRGVIVSYEAIRKWCRKFGQQYANQLRPTHQREWRMQGCKSPGHAQRFLAVYGPIAQHFRPRRYRLSAPACHQEMRQRFNTWREITSLPASA
jgi:hypothetical protein